MSSNIGLKENYFENIDTKEKAYWLGFLYADGCIVSSRIGNPKAVALCLSVKDQEQVCKFCDILSINRDTIKIRKHCIKSIGKEYYSANAYVSSVKIANDLSFNGCGLNKTLRLKLPSLSSEEMYLAFLLGYYDGDGVSGGAVICSGCLSFLLEIKNKFNIPYDPKLKKNPYGQCYILCMGWELKNKIMNNYENSMTRKRKISSGPFRFKKGMQYSVNGKRCGREARPVNISVSKDTVQKMIIDNPILKVCKDLGVTYNGIINYIKDNHLIIPSSQQKSIAKRKFNVSKEELEKLISTTSMLAIGRMFGVSDKAVRKRAKLFGILDKACRKHTNRDRK